MSPDRGRAQTHDQHLSARTEALLREPEKRKKYEREVLFGEATETIAALLKSQGVTQHELARRLGVSPGRVSQIVSGRENLTLRSLAEIGWALGVRFDLVPVGADRAGTPAQDDPPVPRWVGES